MKRERFHSLTSHYPRLRIGVLGDFSLDRYLEIDPLLAEMSIETGLPVHNVVKVRSQPGAAGTILNNLADLGVGTLYPIGFFGEDGEGHELLQAIRRSSPGVVIDHLHITSARHTFTYCKPLLMHRGRPPEELSRLDTKNYTLTPLEVEDLLVQSLTAIKGEIDALIVLDQVDVAGTGVVTRRVLESVAELAQKHPELCILGDSRRGLGGWPKVIWKMNARELAALSGRTHELSGDEISREAVRVASANGRCVFVTQAEQGMLCATPEGIVEKVGAIPTRGPIDVVGAGDAVTANVVAALASGASVHEALQIANTAASIVVHQLGTTGTASREQMAELLFGSMWV